MARSSFWVTFLVLLLGASSAFAEEPVVVRYFVQGGGGLEYPVGDLDGKTILRLDTSVDSSLTPESVSLPDLPIFPEAKIRLGAYIDASSVSVGFGYGRPMIEESSASQPIAPAHASWLSFDFEYQYHFGFPGVWRPAIGASYGFARLDVEGAARAEDAQGVTTVGHVLFSGAMPGVVGALGYYGLPHTCIVAELRGRLASFQNLTTDANDYSALSSSLWQWISGVSVSAQYIF